MIRLAIAVIVLALSVASARAQEPATQPPTIQGFTYNPEGRRDPFVSLLRRGADPQRGEAARPSGIAGLLVSEVSVRGIVGSRNGLVAVLQGADGRTYIVRQGDALFDGVVRSITEDAVVFLQQVNDPLSLDKQREVRKVLRQTQEAQ